MNGTMNNIMNVADPLRFARQLAPPTKATRNPTDTKHP
jgi:hypothetical protein